MGIFQLPESSNSPISLRMGLCRNLQTCALYSIILVCTTTVTVRQLVYKATAELGRGVGNETTSLLTQVQQFFLNKCSLD